MKLFGKRVKPHKSGKTEKNFKIVLAYTVGDYLSEVDILEILSIGSSPEASLCLNHDEVSKIHCKIFNNNGILSVLDCGSSNGTILNKKTLEPNKQYILDISDTLVVGGFNLNFKKVEVDHVEEIHIGSQSPIEEVTADIPAIEIEEDTLEEPTNVISKKIDLEVKPKKRKFKQNKDSLNAYFRVIALCVDVLLIIITLNILSFYFDLGEGIDLMVQELNSLVNTKIQLSGLIEDQFHKLPVLKAFFDDVSALAPISLLTATKYFYLFCFSRILFSSLLGVSLGQLLIGARLEQSGLSAKVKSLARSILDIIFLPLFVITKFSTLFSKVSVEEMLSQSKIQSRHFILSFLLSFIIPIVLLVGYLSLPLLYYPQAIVQKVVSHVKIERTDQEDKSLTNIDYLNLKFFSDEKTIILPRLSVKREKGKSKVYPEVNIINSKSVLKIKKLKEINTSHLFEPLFSDVPFLKIWYPEISSSFNHFKTKNLKMDKLRFEPFALELFKMFKASYKINLDEFQTYIIDNGVFLSPYFKFQTRINSIIDMPFDEIKIYSRKNGIFIFFQKVIRSKAYLNLLSINKETSSLYDVQLSGLDINDLAAGLDIMANVNSQDDITLFFQALGSTDQNLKTLAYQEIYELFYDSAKLSFNNKKNLREISLNAKNLFDYFKTLKNDTSQARLKLVQNFGDLIQAIENEDTNFFNLNEVM